MRVSLQKLIIIEITITVELKYGASAPSISSKDKDTDFEEALKLRDVRAEKLKLVLI
jgi:hypothetical protein